MSRGQVLARDAASCRMVSSGTGAVCRTVHTVPVVVFHQSGVREVMFAATRAAPNCVAVPGADDGGVESSAVEVIGR